MVVNTVKAKNSHATPCRVLVVYDTNGGNCYRMAQIISRGIESIDGCSAMIRAVAKVGDRSSARLPEVPDAGAPHALPDDLTECHGLIIGGPTHFGNMSASLKHYLDETTGHWFAGSLTGKPAGVFTSTGSMHGGQESTLLSMMIPLLHHGMLICGLPYSNPELMQTTRGGTPYGASHVSGESSDTPISNQEAALCKALGARVARAAQSLTSLQL